MLSDKLDSRKLEGAKQRTTEPTPFVA